MATNKTLNPTGVTIAIPAMADKPDASVFSNCIDKEADAINTLNSNKANNAIIANVENGSTFTKAHSVGEYIVDANRELRVIVNQAAVGDTITSKANKVPDGLASQVAALNSNISDMVKIKSLGIGGNQTIDNIKNVCANASFSGMTMDYLYMNDSAVSGWSLVMCSVKWASSSRVTIWILNPSKIITSDTGNLSDWTQKTVNLS